MCCAEHVNLLKTKGLPPTKTNAFVTWYQFTTELNKTNTKLHKLEKEPEQNKDKIESAELYKEKVQQMLNKFNADDVKLFTSVKDHDKVIRRSARINHKGRADLNECIIHLNDSEYLENLENLLGETNVSPELIQARASMLLIIVKFINQFLIFCVLFCGQTYK